MTDIEFRNLCRDDYRRQLSDSGYSDIEKQLSEQEQYFEKAESWENSYGGVLFFIKDNTAFLFYIYVYEHFRNKGYAKILLSVFYEQMKSRGVNKVQLNVFDHNKNAKKLYKNFRVISSLMEKQL